MDDSKSDNTDDLLTSLEPLMEQSEFFIHQEGYKNKRWLVDGMRNSCHSDMPVIVDDIFSSRSVTNSTEWKDKPIFQSPSISNIASHNSRQIEERLNTDRTICSHFYEDSISSQTTPRNMSGNRQLVHVNSGYELAHNSKDSKESAETILTKHGTQLNEDLDYAHSAFNQSRTEVQRLQLSNRQLSTQLHEAKLSIQTLTIQLEQVQQESRHKENTLANLDNTLGKLVSGWKKRESQKDQDLDSMKQHIDAKERAIEECQRMAEESRRALTNADKAVQMEKSRMEQFQKSASVEIQNLKNEKALSMKNNLELANRCASFEADLKKLNQLYSEKTKCVEELNYRMKDDQATRQQENDNLRRDIERLKEEAMNLQFEVQSRADKMSQMKTEMKMLEDEVQCMRKDRDDKIGVISELRTVMKKMQDEHSFALRKQEKELAGQFHQDINKRILDLQDHHKRAIQTLQVNFQGKLNEQSKRHRIELERLRYVAEQEITSRMSDSDETVAMLRERLDRSEKSVQFWQQEKEVVEKARNQISSQLYDLMNGGFRQECGGGGGSVVQGGSTVTSTRELVKPTFIPPKNQGLIQAMPGNFFEPIKSTTITTLSNSTPANHSHNVATNAHILLSASSNSLYY